MKRRCFSVERTTGVLRQVDAGVPVGDVCRQVAVSEQTFYRCKKKCDGMVHSEAREIKQLRDENTKLKRLVIGLTRACGGQTETLLLVLLNSETEKQEISCDVHILNYNPLRNLYYDRRKIQHSLDSSSDQRVGYGLCIRSRDGEDSDRRTVFGSVPCDVTDVSNLQITVYRSNLLLVIVENTGDSETALPESGVTGQSEAEFSGTYDVDGADLVDAQRLAEFSGHVLD